MRGAQPIEVFDSERSADEEREKAHEFILERLRRLEAEEREVLQVIAESREASDPEFGVPPPEAWEAIRQRHPSLDLREEPDLILDDEVVEKLKKAGRLRRIRTRYWNPWQAQDEARDAERLQSHETLNAAYHGKAGMKEWNTLRRKHPGWNLPAEPKLTFDQYFDALFKHPAPGDYKYHSLYSSIKWGKT